MNNQFSITIIDARFTKDKDLLTRMDPYVLVRYGSQEHKTPIARREGKLPVWNDTFCFSFEPTCTRIEFFAFDKDKITKDDCLGSGFLDLTQLKQGPLEIPLVCQRDSSEFGILRCELPDFQNLSGAFSGMSLGQGVTSGQSSIQQSNFQQVSQQQGVFLPNQNVVPQYITEKVIERVNPVIRHEEIIQKQQIIREEELIREKPVIKEREIIHEIPVIHEQQVFIEQPVIREQPVIIEQPVIREQVIVAQPVYEKDRKVVQEEAVYTHEQQVIREEARYIQEAPITYVAAPANYLRQDVSFQSGLFNQNQSLWNSPVGVTKDRVKLWLKNLFASRQNKLLYRHEFDTAFSPIWSELGYQAPPAGLIDSLFMNYDVNRTGYLQEKGIYKLMKILFGLSKKHKLQNFLAGAGSSMSYSSAQQMPLQQPMLQQPVQHQWLAPIGVTKDRVKLWLTNLFTTRKNKLLHRNEFDTAFNPIWSELNYQAPPPQLIDNLYTNYDVNRTGYLPEKGIYKLMRTLFGLSKKHKLQNYYGGVQSQAFSSTVSYPGQWVAPTGVTKDRLKLFIKNLFASRQNKLFYRNEFDTAFLPLWSELNYSAPPAYLVDSLFSTYDTNGVGYLPERKLYKLTKIMFGLSKRHQLSNFLAKHGLGKSGALPGQTLNQPIATAGLGFQPGYQTGFTQ
jgi:hemolysin-activating ACP:hemolysin acyltransferase